MDLSILIPAGKGEEWTSRTVEDILKNKRGNTEILVGLDGDWATPGIIDHKDVKILYSPVPLGQRGMTRALAKMSRAKYIAKTDSHCAFDEGFDVKMLEAFKELGDDVTMVPTMRNLHVFSWKCMGCGKETYQGPTPEGCDACDMNTPDMFEKVVKWIPKQSPQSTAYRFNKELRFKYFPELRRRQQGDYVESMSLQGSFFMMTRDKYWELDVDGEEFGSWGQQGSLVALKTWLSGGRVICNTKTWYAHLFRTQKGFSHPWGNPGRDQQMAIQKSKDLFLNNKWEQQVRPLSWLLERFWGPLQEVGDNEHKWEEKDLDRVKQMKGSKGILFYTTNRLPIKFAKKVQNQIQSIGLPITSVSLKEMSWFGNNIHVPLQPGKWAYFTQILIGLESMSEDIVYMCEHDCIYPKEHFDFTPKDKDTMYYNQNWWKIRDDGFAVHWDAEQVSGLVAYRDTLIKFYRKKLDEIIQKGFDGHYEPKEKWDTWKSPVPYLDIRQKGTLTKDKWSLKDFRNPPVNFQESTLDDISTS